MKIKHVKGIKLASSDLTKIRKVCSLNSPDFKVYCGDDLVLMDFLLYGTSGVISVISNVGLTEDDLLKLSKIKNVDK